MCMWFRGQGQGWGRLGPGLGSLRGQYTAKQKKTPVLALTTLGPKRVRFEIGHTHKESQIGHRLHDHIGHGDGSKLTGHRGRRQREARRARRDQNEHLLVLGYSQQRAWL